MTMTFLLLDIRTTVGPLKVYLQNPKSLQSLRNLPAFKADGLEAVKICRFSERYPKVYIFDVCENQKRQKNVPQEYTLKIRKWQHPCWRKYDQIHAFELGYLKTSWHMKISDCSFFWIFYALLLEPNLY